MNKKSVSAGLAVLIILSGIIFTLAYKANQELEVMVTAQFSNQQLILAGKIADDIRGHCQFLETALTTLSRHAGEYWPEQPSLDYLHSTIEILKDWHVLSLGITREDRDDLLFASTRDVSSWKEMGIDFPEAEFKPWLDSGPEEQIFFSRTFRPVQGPFAGTWVMIMARLLPSGIDKYSEPAAFDHVHPVAFFVVNAMKVTREYAHGVISGQTGYPWVINERGYFLYHIEKDFDGQNSFTVRNERNPDISYERINMLVSQRLLQGEKGTDWYISGWHREVYTEMKKLFAFSPIFFTGPEKEQDMHLWSVGLAAPTDEVYGLIQPIVIRQWMAAGLFLFVVVSGFLGLYLLSLRWNQTLALKVAEKTRHLIHSQDLLQKEKEKVEHSMETLVKTQEKLIQSEKFAAIGEAAAHLSHEIKNPLMLMAGFARQVNRSLPEGSPEKERLDIIAGEAQRLEKMLNEVRDFTRPHTPNKEPFQISGLITDTRDLLVNELDTANINCLLHIPPDLPKVLVDGFQIKQVLLNIMKNALEAMPGGGSLTVRSWTDKDRLWISVEDTGEGISRDKIKNIFSPFITTKQKGTGLGLTVCFRIIQDHGGEIFVDTREGQGSTFSFYLPLSPIRDDADKTAPLQPDPE